MSRKSLKARIKANYEQVAGVLVDPNNKLAVAIVKAGEQASVYKPPEKRDDSEIQDAAEAKRRRKYLRNLSQSKAIAFLAILLLCGCGGRPPDSENCLTFWHYRERLIRGDLPKLKDEDDYRKIVRIAMMCDMEERERERVYTAASEYKHD